MAKVYRKKDAKVSIPDSAVEYVKQMLETENESKL